MCIRDRFKAWYKQHYGLEFGKKATKGKEQTVEEVKKSKHLTKKIQKRAKESKIDPNLEKQMGIGKSILACISSRPGQCGRCDGYILEGKELEFYLKKIEQRKAKK
eukprot:TRINITY_DN2071_c0_g1_i4.p3 TRINITY_DN2071_c0_g1~~TRINITY_DN2071_c0_g1_i4.p3  ORF type:complete len:106 (+),score=49.09 TRINITY_DN2071_c0_g1_i4:72-389(+)